jgi:hypothetical protein
MTRSEHEDSHGAEETRTPDLYRVKVGAASLQLLPATAVRL